MHNNVGIYVGLFDPVHAGHIAFGLRAVEEAGLETVYFLPERMPTYARPVEHYGHRVAMLDHALTPHQALELVEVADKRFRAHQTIPRLQHALGVNRFVFLCNVSSFVRFIEENSEIFRSHDFVVSVKSPKELRVATSSMELYDIPPARVAFVDDLRPDVATEYIQLALGRQKQAPGLLASVAHYARAEWLYASLPNRPRT